MPVSRATAEDLARAIAALYAEGERLMMERIASNLKKGIEQPYWATKKLAQLQSYRAEILQLITDLRQEVATGLPSALTEAYKRGGLAAVEDIGRGTAVTNRLGGLRAVEKITNETLAYLNSTETRILWSAMDAYKKAVTAGSTGFIDSSGLPVALSENPVNQGVSQQLLGTQTRRQAVQSTLDDFASSGVTGFVDTIGRGWSLYSYASMALSAGTRNAAIAGHLDTLQENGLDLVIVNEDGSPCPDCAPWEGEILSISGESNEYPSIDDAEADGLGHPNCMHVYSAYQEGITQLYPEKSEEEVAAQAQLYQDKQDERAIERSIRQAKNELAVAMDSTAARAATSRVEYYQAQAREHVATSGATRDYTREQIG